MDEMLDPVDIANVKIDLEDIGEGGNKDKVVKPRYGGPYKSIPMVSREGEEKFNKAVNDFKTRYYALSLRGEWAPSTDYQVKDLVFVENITYICLIVHTSSSNFQEDANSGKWIIYQGVTQVDLQYFTPLNEDYPPVITERSIRLKIDHSKGAMRFGLSDLVPLDDLERNFFRGLKNKDAWAPENIGIGSNAGGRNNCAPNYLSDAGNGHDCLALGIASSTRGVACCTGNPDKPEDGTTWGYAAEAGGRNCLAQGRESFAFGEFCDALARYCVAMGYKAIAGPSDPEDPNYLPDGVEGAAAHAHGYEVKAHGNFALALGAFVEALNGAQVIGRGLFTEQGIKPLKVSKRGLGIGYNVDKPTIFCKEGDGISGNGAWIGFNTELPISRYDYRFGESDTITKVIESVSGNGLLADEVKGLMADGKYKSLHNMIVTHPNAGTPYATVQFRLNGIEYLTVDQSRKATFTNGIEAGGAGLFVAGKRVVGGQLPPIDDLTTSANLSDVITKLNEMLASLRDGTGHGLIAK
ncbi:hypothetical protein QZJ98_06500 [Acinetobacter baumannii]|nr:hypothetical protein [Acinetobacter baumannii]